jgi:hypothetical protein
MRPPTITARAGFLVLCVCIALVATACGGDDDAVATTVTAATSLPSASTTAATTAAPPTTTTAATTTTTAATTTTTIDTNTLASGSGCTPGTDDLPDGEWFGLVADASAGEVEFDLACWFTGDAATMASAEDGEESPPPNDYYVRNTNPALRKVTIAADAQVVWLPNVGDPASALTIAYSDWLAERDIRGVELQPSVWITITDDEVVAIEEQYVP